MPEDDCSNPASDESADAESANETAGNECRLLLWSGVIFLTVFSCQYLWRVFDRPERLPWERGEAFQTYRVDMNSATWVEWTQLRGIGPALAHRIVAYREIHGPFQSIDDLQRVDGIGPKTLQSLRPMLTISQPSERSAD